MNLNLQIHTWVYLCDEHKSVRLAGKEDSLTPTAYGEFHGKICDIYDSANNTVCSNPATCADALSVNVLNKD